ncbi:Thioesterase superfamily [Penicillium cf. griseofulvum]|nr:Thioesterase superfamily [Penicillium cf. griseofulvum]
MSDNAIGAPSRELDEFEQLVYEYAGRMGVGSEGHWDVDARGCNLRFESATRGPPATVSFLLTITPALSNYMGKFALGGVSRNLKVTYLRPVPTGMEVRLVCEVVHVGKRLALLRAEIQKADSRDICVVGEHEKANTDPEVTQRI